jgi:hypothetical protein
LNRPRSAAVIATVAVMTLVMAACASAPPVATSPPPATVAATWVADDGTVVAMNLVVAPGTTPTQIRNLAERERRHHRRARVIVRVFGATAGAERYVIGHVPPSGEPIPGASQPASLIAVYDFPRWSTRVDACVRVYAAKDLCAARSGPSHRP